MNSSSHDLPVIYLKTGELYFSEQPATVITVLGSCLAVTLFHRRTGTGAICHGLMPECRERAGCSSECREPGKYVECAIQWMVNRFRRKQVMLRETEVKVFGGSDMFDAARNGKGGIPVGKLNITMAMKRLELEGLHILSIDVGGAQGRKLFFDTGTGEVLLKRLPPRVILAER